MSISVFEQSALCSCISRRFTSIITIQKVCVTCRAAFNGLPYLDFYIMHPCNKDYEDFHFERLAACSNDCIVTFKKRMDDNDGWDHFMLVSAENDPKKLSTKQLKALLQRGVSNGSLASAQVVLFAKNCQYQK
jgi:hypothetical protein